MAGRLAPERWTDDPTELYPDVNHSVAYVDADDRPLEDDEDRHGPATDYSKYHA
jgi:hypothetical protein